MKYSTMEGKETTGDNPNRFLWYGICGMWTDDLTKINSGPPPHCPECGSPGFQVTAKEWFDGIENYAKENPGYHEEVNQKREKCPKPRKP